ncbi:MAG: hypothetical protein DRR06_19825 [Gammaproteobacteria bacterium]|nr:MAG: hypothetical protein DRR06_19825 [Gammaproteobacteria bacterium]
MQPTKHLKRNLSAGLALLCVVVLAIGIHRIRFSRLAQTAAMVKPPWALRTAAVMQQSIARSFPVLATLSTASKVSISGQVSGSLLEMGPREGQAIRKNDLLARIDTRELEEQRAAIQAKLSAARAEVDRAQNEAQREQQLFQEGGSSQTDLENRQTARISAEQTVKNLQRQIASIAVRIGYGKILAPADGVVAARLAEPGDICIPGHPLYELTLSKGARIKVRLPQKILSQTLPGTPVQLQQGDEVRRYRLNRIFPSVDESAMGTAEADAPELPFGLPSGTRIPAAVILEQLDQALVVPRNSLLPSENTVQKDLYKVIAGPDQQLLKRITVTVDLNTPEGVAVKGDLNAGDQVVVAHRDILLRLRDEDAVVIEGNQP